MLTLKEGQYILGAWFIGPDASASGTERTDWFAICFKETPEGPWRVCHRVCHYGRAGVPDQRQWKQPTLMGPPPRPRCSTPLEQFAMLLAQRHEAPLHSVHIQGDVHRAFTLLQAQDWFQTEALE